MIRTFPNAPRPAVIDAGTADTKPGAYYVSMIDGPRTALLSGPYIDDHVGALAYVRVARYIAQELDPQAWFYAFGTCRLDPGIEHPTASCKSRDSCGGHGGS